MSMALKRVPRLSLRTRSSFIFALLISTTLVLFISCQSPSTFLVQSLSKNTKALSSILPSAPTLPESPSVPLLPPLPAPSDYQGALGQKEYCQQRYSTKYLEALRNGEVSYCTPASPSQLTCFHTPSGFHEDGHIDSFCIGQGSVYDATTNRFALGCLPKPDVAVPIAKLHTYWYRTGPRYLLHSYFSTVNTESPAWRPENEFPSQRTFSILVKREGANNVFHVLHEIMSLTYSMDVLRMSRDPQTGKPRFSQEDIANTQIVIMDNLEDGGFLDLWRLVSDRPIKRLSELVSEDPQWLNNNENTLILPLAGGANPAWHQEQDDHDCINELREVFSRRVLDFYQIPHGQSRDRLTQEVEDNGGPLVLTFVNRTSTRQLNNADMLLDDLRARFYPNDVRVQSVDFAAIPLREQIEVARGTDILVGVHGAGLTHALFMKPHRGAVVEIFPATLEFNALRAIALERGLAYHSTHDTAREGVRDWQEERLDVDETVFRGLVDAAVDSLVNRVGSFIDVE